MVRFCIILRKEVISGYIQSIEKRYHYKVFLSERFDVHFFHKLLLYVQHEVLTEAIYEFINNFNLITKCIWRRCEILEEKILAKVESLENDLSQAAKIIPNKAVSFLAFNMIKIFSSIRIIF